jgi:hypothetical protein
MPVSTNTGSMDLMTNALTGNTPYPGIGMYDTRETMSGALFIDSSIVGSFITSLLALVTVDVMLKK